MSLTPGLWRENAAMVQLLGLCPMLAVSNTIVNAVCMGLATTVVLGLSNTGVSLARGQVPYEIRIPVFVLLIAVLVTIIQLLMNAYAHRVYVVLGIFVPLIVTNCLLLARAESFASRNTPGAAFLDGIGMGLGLTFVLAIVGAARELLGNGTLFANIHLALGAHAKDWVWHVFPKKFAFPLAALPAGGFIVLGLLIALKNVIDAKRGRAARERPPAGASAAMATATAQQA
jgi:Na+-translocating ferredoxin:NAD+ oxidoreductase subunit E